MQLSWSSLMSQYNYVNTLPKCKLLKDLGEQSSGGVSTFEEKKVQKVYSSRCYIRPNLPKTHHIQEGAWEKNREIIKMMHVSIAFQANIWLGAFSKFIPSRKEKNQCFFHMKQLLCGTSAALPSENSIIVWNSEKLPSKIEPHSEFQCLQIKNTRRTCLNGFLYLQ